MKNGKRCPICNCQLNSAVALVGNEQKLEVLMVCNNHKYLGKRTPISFTSEAEFSKLDNFIQLIKEKKLTVCRETVGYQKFLQKIEVVA